MKQSRANGKAYRSLWFWVILVFAVLISAWTALIIVAARNQPEIIEIQQP